MEVFLTQDPGGVVDRVLRAFRPLVSATARASAHFDDAGVTHFLEVGSGRVLSGLVSRIQRRSQRAQFSGMQDLESVQEFLQTV